MKYTVIGYYSDTNQRFATEVEADKPEHATWHAYAESDSPETLVIVAVVDGSVCFSDHDSETTQWSNLDVDGMPLTPRFFVVDRFMKDGASFNDACQESWASVVSHLYDGNRAAAYTELALYLEDLATELRVIDVTDILSMFELDVDDTLEVLSESSDISFGTNGATLVTAQQLSTILQISGNPMLHAYLEATQEATPGLMFRLNN